MMEIFPHGSEVVMRRQILESLKTKEEAGRAIALLRHRVEDLEGVLRDAIAWYDEARTTPQAEWEEHILALPDDINFHKALIRDIEALAEQELPE